MTGLIVGFILGGTLGHLVTRWFMAWVIRRLPEKRRKNIANEIDLGAAEWRAARK